MAERPPVRRSGGSPASRWGAALVGLLIGVGLLAAVAWALGARGDEDEAAPRAAATDAGSAPAPVLRIVFPEGFTRKQMAARIRDVNRIAVRRRGIEPALSPAAYLRTTRSSELPGELAGDEKKRRMEGFLFPATYEFTEDTTSEELVDMQLATFRRAWDRIDLSDAESRELRALGRKLTAYDVLIIASMIEEEVRVPKERPLVAAVIFNRLDVGLPLGIDATVRYGLDIPPTEAIRESQLDSDSPYNTRKFTGLPPTPISNPGLASMQAAAHPAEVDYLFFIRKADCKSHFFTASEQEFLDYPRAGLSC